MGPTSPLSPNQLRNDQWLDMTRYPTVLDIISLKRSFSRRLPNELIDMILDLAEYWPHSSCASTSANKAGAKARLAEWMAASSLEYCRSEVATRLSFADSHEDGFLLRSPPLGIFPIDVVQNQASLVPQTRHPFRMIIFEVRYCLYHGCSRRNQVVRQSSTYLELGIKKPVPPTESPSRVIDEPATGLTAQIVEGSPQLQQFCDHVYKSWLSKRRCVHPAHTYLKSSINHDALEEGARRQQIVFWRWDDDDLVNVESNHGWDLNGEAMGHLSEAERAHVNNFVLSLAKEEWRERASFVRQLEVGNTLGVWVAVRDGSSVSLIDGIKMHVFWAAS